MKIQEMYQTVAVMQKSRYFDFLQLFSNEWWPYIICSKSFETVCAVVWSRVPYDVIRDAAVVDSKIKL